MSWVDLLEEITLRVRRVNAPPVVYEDVEDGEENDEERSRPLGLETEGNHDASTKTDQRE